MAGEIGGLAHWYRDARPKVPFDPVPNRLPSLVRAFDAALKPLLGELWQATTGRDVVRVGNVSGKTYFEAVQKLADDVCGVLLLAIRARQPLDEQTTAHLRELHAARQLPDFDFSLSQVDCEIVPKYVRKMVRVSYADIDFLKEGVTREAIDLQKLRAAAKPKRSKRRRKVNAARKQLTPKQTQAVEAYADLDGDIPKAARRCGISPKAMRNRLEGAWKKIGKRPMMNAIKAKTKGLPTDKRGQEIVFSDE